MTLYTLYFGNNKKKMRPIMTDSKEKCLAYQNARENSGNNSKASRGWHKIELAESGAEVWRKKSATVGGNKPMNVEKTTGKNRGPNGYIGKHGFNPHT